MASDCMYSLERADCIFSIYNFPGLYQQARHNYGTGKTETYKLGPTLISHFC